MDANSYKLHASGYYDVLLLGKLPIMVSTSRDHQVFYSSYANINWYSTVLIPIIPIAIEHSREMRHGQRARQK